MANSKIEGTSPYDVHSGENPFLVLVSAAVTTKKYHCWSRKHEDGPTLEEQADFVDFLFSLISLPLGQVVNLLTKNKMVGCIGNLYGSIESLSETYIQSSQNVASILNPKSSMVSFQNPLLLSNKGFEVRKEPYLYMCLHEKPNYNPRVTHHPHVSDVPNTRCPCCKKVMTYELQFVESEDYQSQGLVAPESGGGFVEGVVTYMVMDNLEVKEMSTISSISILTKSFNIQDLTSLEEKVVSVGVEEGLRILQMSLQSKDVLTTIFLRNYVPPEQAQKRKRAAGNVTCKKNKKRK